MIFFLLAQRFYDTEEKLKGLKEEAELVGLHIDISNTKGMTVNTSNMQNFSLEETEFDEFGSIVCLGSVVSESGGTEEDVSCVEKSQHVKRS